MHTLFNICLQMKETPIRKFVNTISRVEVWPPVLSQQYRLHEQFFLKFILCYLC